jgi:hypothetical protein
MLTGDHPATARIMADKAGLPPGDPVLGSDLPVDGEALASLLSGPVSVFARITPDQKLRIARALQARGEVVAMTGDGVNDAPALRQADIGVAMGLGGSDVAREAADIVLLDDNFAHIVDAVEEGRAVFDNIRRFLTYDLTVNVAELAPFLVWGLSAGKIPLALTVLQLLALDLGVSLLPAMALGGEPPEAATMTRPPRSRAERTLDRRVLGRAFGFLGPLEAALSLAFLPAGAALYFGWHPGQPTARRWTRALAALHAGLRVDRAHAVGQRIRVPEHVAIHFWHAFPLESSPPSFGRGRALAADGIRLRARVPAHAGPDGAKRKAMASHRRGAGAVSGSGGASKSYRATPRGPAC